MKMRSLSSVELTPLLVCYVVTQSVEEPPLKHTLRRNRWQPLQEIPPQRNSNRNWLVQTVIITAALKTTLKRIFVSLVLLGNILPSAIYMLGLCEPAGLHKVIKFVYIFQVCPDPGKNFYPVINHKLFQIFIKIQKAHMSI